MNDRSHNVYNCVSGNSALFGEHPLFKNGCFYSLLDNQFNLNYSHEIS